MSASDTTEPSHLTLAAPASPFRLALLVLFFLGGCEQPDPFVVAEPGEPLPGLPQAELRRFHSGQALFARQFTPEDGLGPTFNENACMACHDIPTSGGVGVEPVVMATRWLPVEERCDTLESEGGPLLRRRTTSALQAALARKGLNRQSLPPSATASTQLTGPALYGLGLVEAIPEATILSRHDPDDEGTTGRPGRNPDGKLGRFGIKADRASLVEFVADALLTEMGLTSPYRPEELSVDGASLPPGVDPVPNPEITEEEVALLAEYIRYLAPPPRLIPEDADSRAKVARGEQLFQTVGCATCHVPEMVTGPSQVEALDRRPVPLYSDLLLHDLGPGTASICSPRAGPSEWRTAILMGLRFRMELLHDGRAARLEQAIQLHGGSAAKVREAYFRLDLVEQEAVLAFLRTL